jgi:hypothetical protein
MKPEVSLGGRWGSRGIVRIGATVRRPTGPNSATVHALLRHLEATAFSHAPRFLGIDDQGRETLWFIEGWVPSDLGFFSQRQFEAAARIIAAFHRATAGGPLAGSAEVVCHGDLSPCNFVFRGDVPVAIIDFEASPPRARHPPCWLLKLGFTSGVRRRGGLVRRRARSSVGRAAAELGWSQIAFRSRRACGWGRALPGAVPQLTPHRSVQWNRGRV